jgi:AcrR family transcriptional regulator
MTESANVRRSQEERTASTRAKLLDATIDCLFEVGFAHTTTTEVARRAGVSRGAQLHHFPTKTELVITAVDHLINRRRDEFVERFAALPAGLQHTDAAIDMLWDILSGPTFFAWLELMVAARTDDELRPVVAALSARFAETVQRTFLEIFPRPQDAGALYDTAPHFVFAVLQGLALEINVLRDKEQVDEVLAVLKRVARSAIPEKGTV